MLRRNAIVEVDLALADTPVILLNGPRQSGKSTLARMIADSYPGSGYVTLDDPATLAAARRDPSAFVERAGGPFVIDEVQRAPDLFLTIKAAVDRDRRPGRFVLTGSSNIFLVPRISESLAGRMEIIPLWPFSQGEMENVQEGFIDALFGDEPFALPPPAAGSPGLQTRVLRGGFPEVQARATSERRAAWFSAYLATVLQRDVRDLANIEGLAELPRVLELLAARAGSTLNAADLGRLASIPRTTLLRYLLALEAVYLYQPLRPFATTADRRLTHAPKVHLCDSGLLAHLQGLGGARFDRDRTRFGPLLETFVFMELRKQMGWNRTRVSAMHLRTYGGREADIVLEEPGGRIAGIEVKASMALGPGDFRGLAALRDLAGPKFHRGVILYAGREALPLGDRLFALPVEALWRLGARPNAPPLAD